MPSTKESLAGQMIDALYASTAGRSQKRVMLHTIAKQLKLMDDTATHASVQLAVDRGWLVIGSGLSLCLTDAGRRMAR